MDEAHKLEIADRLDAVLERYRTSEDEDTLLAARDELADIWPELMGAVPLVGAVVKNAVPGGQNDIRLMSPTEVKDKLIPGLDKFGAFLRQGSGPKPNRPGCFGGTGAILMLALLLFQLLR